MSHAASERIVTSAPMSFSGSLRRTRLWLHGWVFWTLGLTMIAVWWTTILAWYLTFGVLLVPYRLIRRGARRRRLEDARHRELLAELSRQAGQITPAEQQFFASDWQNDEQERNA